MSEEAWGRVDETGTVFVREGESWREVGQYPDASEAEALAYFERKYADLEGQVRLLEQRARGGANAADVSKQAGHVRDAVSGANAVGDLQALLTRLEALGADLEVRTAEQEAENQAEVEAAVAERTAIVEAVEALAAKDPQQTQWKQASAELDAMFARWQEHQKNGPRIPKGTSNDLWKRFRDARSTIESHRRAFFAELDTQHRDAKQRKEALVEEARGLASRGTDGIPAYRQLLDRWKAAGRAGRKVDDALWAEFRAAGDVLYQAKAEAAAVENEEYSGNLAAKRALLDEAKPILQERDRGKARALLTDIQRRWDEIGRVPREALREIEDGIRGVEAHVRALDESHWRDSNPERKARSEGMAGQLEDQIAKLEEQLNAAAAGSKEAKDLESELATKRQWLDVVQRAG